MKRIVLFAIAIMFVLGMGNVAQAACTDISIGADIIVWMQYMENYDFNDDVEDEMSKITQKTKVYLYNTYTDNVKTTVRLDAWGNDANKQMVELDQAYIVMTEFLHESLTFTVGKMSWGWQMRKQWGGHSFYQLVMGDMESAFVVKVKPIGWTLSYKVNSDIAVSAGFGKVAEHSLAGNNSNDIDVWFLRYDHMLGESNKLFVALIYYSDNYDTAAMTTLPGDVWYFNAGIDYFLMDETLELYVEFSYQDGDVHDDAFEFGGFALDLGAEYTFADVETVPYIGIEIVYYSGVDNETYGYVRFNTNWNRTLIGMSDFFGMPWSSDWMDSGMGTGGAAAANYRGGYYALMLQGGMKSIADDKVSIDVVLAFYEAVGDMPAGVEKGLGWEFDIVASYWYTEDVTFTAGLGYFSPDEEFAGNDPDGAIIFVFGVNIDF